MSTPSTAPPRAAGHWRVAGLAVLGTWALLLAVAVVLWVRVVVFADPDGGTSGAVRLFGGPFVLLALGILWWVWHSARHLRNGRPQGWTLLLVLGGVALVQSVVTGLPLVASGGAALDAVAPFLVGAGLGAVSVGVGLQGRRSGARLEATLSDGG